MHPLRFTAPLILAVLIFSACASQRGNVAETAADACTAPANTAQGAFTGERAADGTCSWKGIPFASSGPEYRFRRPGPPPTVGEVRAANAFGPACLSPVLNILAPGGVAEDCLNLNIWASESIAPGDIRGRPVMVFFYGGAFILGSGSWMVYDGADLAKNGVIVITINYRMGPLGFYASSAQRDETEDGAAGNWGIWDQVAALQWVRANIQAFGGDPKNVTIFGESAGGYSVCTLLAAPAARGLFDRAIMQSGGCLAHTLDQQLEAGKKLLSRTACAGIGAADEMACLRKLDVEDLNLWQKMWNGSQPTVDGVLLLEQPLEALRNGRSNPVPLLVGANRDELRPLSLIPTIAWNLAQSRASYWDALSNSLSVDEAQLLKSLYPDRKGAGTREIWVDMMGDIFFRCSASSAAAAQAQFAPVFAYEFDIGPRETWSEKQMGAYHSIDIPYVFGFHGWPRVMNGGVDILSRTTAYSQRIQEYWTNFARTGNPNGHGRNDWPAYGPGRTTTRLTPAGNRPMPRYLEKQCAYWASKGYKTFPDQAAFLSSFSGQAGVPLGAAFDVE